MRKMAPALSLPAIFAALCLMASGAPLTVSPAHAQDKPVSQMSQADARTYFEQYMARKPKIDACGGVFLGKGERIAFSETGLTIGCAGGKSFSLEFAQPLVAWRAGESGHIVCV